MFCVIGAVAFCLLPERQLCSEWQDISICTQFSHLMLIARVQLPNVRAKQNRDA